MFIVQGKKSHFQTSERNQHIKSLGVTFTNGLSHDPRTTVCVTAIQVAYTLAVAAALVAIVKSDTRR